MPQRNLFGTDGIRGVAGSPPLDPVTVTRVGRAIAQALTARDSRPLRVLIGRDTRESGPVIEQALATGLAAAGADVVSGGILTTPAVSFLASENDFDGGIVISASHNPFSDNGIKVFGGDGFKLSAALEGEIERRVADHTATVADDASNGHRDHVVIDDDPSLHRRYVTHLLSALPDGFRLDGRRVLLDCANGAASMLAPEVFQRLGAEVVAFSSQPDGRNINHGCGALHPEGLAGEVLRASADLGCAYDGDADRCILVDDTGAVRDGDDVLALAATAWRTRLEGKPIVTTIMANLGLELHLQSLGFEVVRTPVGDKYVVDEMRRRGALLGGEQSGHLVFLDRSATGDGILTSLMVARIMVESGRQVSTLAGGWHRLPQILTNVVVGRRVALDSVPAVRAKLDEIEAAMRDRGRVLVRYSGTEPLLRIMLEGDDAAEISAFAADLADTARRALA